MREAIPATAKSDLGMANVPSAKSWRPGVMAKFASGFAALLATAAVLGAFAVARLGAVDDAARTIGGHWLQTTRALGDISYLGQRFRVIEAAVILAPPTEAAAEVKTLRSIRKDIEAAFAREAKLVESAEEKAGFEAIKAAWAAYLSLDDRFLAAAAHSGDAAAQIYRSDMRDSIHEFQGVLKKAITSNVAQADAAARASDDEGAAAERELAAGFAVLAVLCLFVGWRLQGAIVRPIRALTGAMTRLADGATDLEIPGLSRADEIGEMARATAVFKDASRERRAKLEREAQAERAAAKAARDAATAERERISRAQTKAIGALGAGLRALAGGDLQRRLDSDFPAEFASLRDHYEEARKRLAATLRAVAASSSRLADEHRRLGDGADELSARTERQAANLEQSSAALQEIADAVKRSSEGATQGRAAAAAADKEAKRGSNVVGEAVAAMDGLSKSAKEIREITGLIDEIAFQTNLLALNAGVEAARAGEAGRGFAVVATEVRALAQRSADMAKRISDLISTSDRQVAAGVAKVGATGDALARIAAEIAGLHGIVDAIARGAADQASGLEEVSAAFREMDQVTQRNAAMVQQSGAATRRVADEIAGMDGLMRQFQVDDERPRNAA